LPPLRERREDVPALAELFLRRAAGPNKTTPHLQTETVRELCRRDWPGNVRELRNAIEHGALMARGGAIAPEHLPPATKLDHQSSLADPAAMLHHQVHTWAERELATADQTAELYDRFLSATEPALFNAVLTATNQNRAQAANILGIHRATLRKKLSGESDSA
jgi:two-component system nitrogen regulation response regulator GlnG